MKTFIRTVGIITLMVAIGLSVIGCGEDDGPKSLAKQTVAEFQKYVKAEGMKVDTPLEIALALSTWNAMMQFMPTPAFTDLNNKINALSEADQKICQDEMSKLLGVK